MEENKTEQISLVDNVENKEENCDEKTGEISLGKFKDVKELLNAYNTLLDEYSKRCQAIKELEGKENKTENNSVLTENGGTTKELALEITEDEKEKIVKEYLKGLISNQTKMVFLEDDGVISKTTINKPKSIDEAGSLAKSMFNK